MLNFKIWNIFIIISICILVIIYALPNFILFLKINENTFLPGKTINLGLYLQGGSYLLLEADIKSVLNERLETVNDDVSRRLKEFNILPLSKNIRNQKLIIDFDSSEDLSKSKNILRQFFGAEFNISSNNNKLFIEYT